MIFHPHGDAFEDRIALGWQELTGLCLGKCVFSLLVREGQFLGGGGSLL